MSEQNAESDQGTHYERLAQLTTEIDALLKELGLDWEWLVSAVRRSSVLGALPPRHIDSSDAA